MATKAEKVGYKDHRPGSAKGEVHRVFDQKGPEAAKKYAASKKLSEATARVWCSTWARAAKKAPTKTAAKKGATKTATKKAA